MRLKSTHRNAALIAFMAAGLAGAEMAAAEPATEINSAPKVASTSKPAGEQMTMAIFLDRLMMAESAGNDQAKNPRSTAVGPFQFIESTFLDVVRRNFADEVAKLTDEKVLALRTDRAFSRRVAEVFSRENGAQLAAAGHKPTFVNLRLAFLLGPAGAIRVLEAKPESKLVAVLPANVIRANPFMAKLTALGLIERAARDLAASPKSTSAITPDKSLLARARTRRPAIRVRCDLGRASCRKWLALQRRKQSRRSRVSSNQ